MLRAFVESHHCLFADRVSDWREAIRLSCRPLEEDGSVEPSYAQLIIDCVERYGPYIIIMPNVCLAHSQENAEGVHKTGISFLHLQEPVLFQGSDGPQPVQLVFALSACDPEKHLQNVVALSDLLSIPGMAEKLAEAGCEADLLRLQETYLDCFHRF